MVIEKPIGTNLAEAQELNREVLKVLDEPQVFRIDHYLGKETVQNMLAFRFANGMFEPVWSRNFIDYVQITAAEDIGIGTRAGYYDQSGALRDLVQNHMLQLLTLLCMEPPVTFSAGDVRDEKVKVLHAIHTPDPDRVPSMAVRPVLVRHGRGQARARLPAGGGGARRVHHRELRRPPARGRQLALGRRADLLRTGKRLARKVTEIAVTLKPVPHLAFEQAGSVGVQPNQIDDRCSRTRACLVAGRQDPRHTDADPAREHGSSTGRRSCRSRLRRTSGCSWTRCAATPRCSPRVDEVEEVAGHRPDPRGLVRDPRAAPAVPGRLGRSGGGGRADRRRPHLARDLMVI